MTQMEVILIYDSNRHFLGVAADYRSAVLLLAECKWLTERLEICDKNSFHWSFVSELLGDNWLAKTLAMTIDEFNDFYESQFFLVAEDIISYPEDVKV